MAIGSLVRVLFGPYEHRVSEAYRSIYVDLDGFTERIRHWRRDAVRVLEIGCGEGAMTERLANIYPRAEIVAIDITPRIGRLYRGPTDNVRFLQTTAQEMAATRRAEFDLIVLADVIHHVPPALRVELFVAAKSALAHNGALVFKDWKRANTPIHALCYASDRWITGDRVQYMTVMEMREILTRVFGPNSIAAEAHIKPWGNNIAFLVRG
ncbi:class I SAM-dependent methyltransferase [Paraburkholderia sp. LEh10]|uniref:class I SAM-dependent methyltransferase n=1 Tax=Paraburkholderia sp. LEh10 TaxID=2821353 RepID=UPI001AE1415D|nr:class I SAM-dependent methyltransferase [Paraburkholderia sp. LEh10]MBP0591590.1 class I SAM-dependent methyltransferase [Paraburkholderia sp. LEh10]